MNFAFSSRERAAKKVFLGFLNPFSSEKGFKPPEALERSDHSRRSRATGAKRGKRGAKRRDIRKKALKGVRGKNKSFSPAHFHRLTADENAAISAARRRRNRQESA